MKPVQGALESAQEQNTVQHKEKRTSIPLVKPVQRSLESAQELNTRQHREKRTSPPFW